MATVEGVLGPIDTQDLGFTLMHEHIMIANWSMRQSFADWVDTERIIEVACDVIPALGKNGVTGEQIQAMTVDNPRRIFEKQGCY